jgi:HAD superfamily hydrolase (TIGR01509 family)
MIRAVVFDFDGVIANSEPLHFQAFRDVLFEEGHDLTEADYYTRYLGFDDVGVFRQVAVDRQLPLAETRVAALAERKAVRLEELERGGALLFPGAEQTIRRLAAVFPLAIASGALGVEIRRVLERTGLLSCFVGIVAAEDTPASKPAPDPYRRAVQLLRGVVDEGLEPGECAAIEDSRWGLDSARAAGLRTVAVTHSYAAGALHGADAVIDSLEQLTVEFLSGLDGRRSTAPGSRS